MIQGGSFHAIWDEEAGLWTKDEYAVQRLVDQALYEEAKRMGTSPFVLEMRTSSTGSWKRYRQVVRDSPDNAVPLDTKLVFANTEVKKTDYATRRLSYYLEEGDISAWDELVGTLYNVDEREKIEWAIGAVISGTRSGSRSSWSSTAIRARASRRSSTSSRSLPKAIPPRSAGRILGEATRDSLPRRSGTIHWSRMSTTVISAVSRTTLD
jgi:hypothetical protein